MWQWAARTAVRRTRLAKFIRVAVDVVGLQILLNQKRWNLFDTFQGEFKFLVPPSPKSWLLQSVRVSGALVLLEVLLQRYDPDFLKSAKANHGLVSGDDSVCFAGFGAFPYPIIRLVL